MQAFHYVGSELELFAEIHNWKRYWSRQIRPFIGGDVLEIGAGIGANTPFLDVSGQSRWICLEPDPQLCEQLENNLRGRKRREPYEIMCGTLTALDPAQQFDTIIYIDVLEHIRDDREELARAAAHLNRGGCAIVVAPAHQWLFTPFDQAVGHFRRYTRSMLLNIAPENLRIERMRYLDSVGMAASAANRLLLEQQMPTRRQLQIWSWMVEASRVTDKLFLYRVGKTIVAAWRKV